MKTNQLLTITFSVLLLLTTSCATIMNGTVQQVQVHSKPSNAKIWVDNNYVGETPKILALSRIEDHHVHLELEGYQQYDLFMKRHISGWIIGNMIIGGPLGLVIDIVSGGIYVLTPKQVQAELKEEKIISRKNKGTTKMFVVLEPKPEWKKVGQLAQSS